jgi:RNA polymerase sigma-70 factor (ECF subfamily)
MTASTVSDPDLALVTRVLGGDRAAFDTLVGTYHTRLLRVARSFVRDAAAAEEVVQETWKAVFAQLGKFEGRATLRGWIFTILTNQAKTRGVRDRRFVPFSALVEPGEEDAANRLVEAASFKASGAWATPPRAWSSETPEAILMRREAMQALEGAIEALPDNLRTVVTMRDVAGLSSEEVCNALGLTEINQRVLLHRARARLRKALAAHLEPA